MLAWVITCPRCDGTIGLAHHELFGHTRCGPHAAPAVDPQTRWKVAKQLTRAQRYQEQFQRRKGWRPFMKAQGYLNAAEALLQGDTR